MSKDKRSKNDFDHPIGCGCTPSLFVNMMDDAGRELSRRQFIKGAGVVGGVLAFGSLLPSYSDAKPLSLIHI